MPESNVVQQQQQFSKPPVGKKALSAEEMQTLVDDKLGAVAQVLGGTVLDKSDPKKPVPAEPEFKVDDEDKRRYIRSMLAKEPFTKAYMLFGGVLKVAFRTRKTKEVEELAQLAPREKFKAQLITSVLGVEMTSNGSAKPAVLTDLDDVAYSAIFDAFKLFEDLCDELFRRANDPDFWTRTAGPI